MRRPEITERLYKSLRSFCKPQKSVWLNLLKFCDIDYVWSKYGIMSYYHGTASSSETTCDWDHSTVRWNSPPRHSRLTAHMWKSFVAHTKYPHSTVTKTDTCHQWQHMCWWRHGEVYVCSLVWSPSVLVWVPSVMTTTRDWCTQLARLIRHFTTLPQSCPTANLGSWHMLQKLAPEIGDIDLNLTPGSGARFSCQCTTSNVIDCLRTLKAVNDVRSRASAWKTGAGTWHRIYSADFWSRFLQHVSEALLLVR